MSIWLSEVRTKSPKKNLIVQKENLLKRIFNLKELLGCLERILIQNLGQKGFYIENLKIFFEILDNFFSLKNEKVT